MSQADAYLEARLHRRRRVEDVMTTVVVTADRLTPYKEIVCLLAEHRISSLPVLAYGWQVIGMVSETELLAARSKRAALTAGELMTVPVTIRPGATISAATRVMTAHHVTSLPVTGADRQLIGIVSRRDLLSVFLRPDADIISEVWHLLGEMPFRDPAELIVTVRHGVVALAGVARAEDHHDLLPLALRTIWDIDGVVDVVTGQLRAKVPAKPGSRPLADRTASSRVWTADTALISRR